jgi:hypothetical protein
MEREKAILINAVQDCKDLSAAEKDELRDYLNATYKAANGSQDRLLDLSRANMLGARITVRAQSQLGKIASAVKVIQTMLEKAAEEKKIAEQAESDSRKISGRFAAIIELAKIVKVPLTIVIVVLLIVLMLKPELAELVKVVAG